MSKRSGEQQRDAEKQRVLEREGNRVDGEAQPPSGVRPGEGRDESDETAGGVDKSL